MFAKYNEVQYNVKTKKLQIQ